MRLTFGEGKIAVAPARHEGANVLILSEGEGAGVIGQTAPGMLPGSEYHIKAADVVLQFNKKESLQVVIDELEQLKRDFELSDEEYVARALERRAERQQES